MTGDITQVVQFFPELSTFQINQLNTLGQLLREWNTRINLISRKDIDHVYEHHILYSLAPAKFIAFNPGEKVLDVGTGGGLPGLPLAVFWPDTLFHLIDRTGKKIKTVREMAHKLALKNVTVEQTAVEEHHLLYNYVLGRGITRFRDFVRMVRHNLMVTPARPSGNGIIYLKGGDVEPEVRKMPCPVKIISLSDYFSGTYFGTKKIIYCPAGKWIKER
ncbi:MAG: 16S rRNA (guanine(527)-N(7))-methyltransferase RsmG [Chlorobi bacterium]|nr:16S rRNA (guanine(527)-N(7))-methyltransferase RsmG [Chlorobiota bacterium]